VSTKWTEPIACPCGRTNQVLLFESLSVDRLPECRVQTLDRTLMSVTCACGTRTAIVKPILYADMTRGWWIHVALDGELAAAERVARAEFDAAFDTAKFPPAVAAIRDSLRMRLVFGFEELREKVVCADHGLDDRLVEILKLDLLATSDLMANGADALVLEGVDADAALLHFHAVRGDGERIAKLSVRRIYAGSSVNALRFAAAG
jgi:hypothetical protein